jgi:pimeloyl-ACP methyl ester carboxylesterase
MILLVGIVAIACGTTEPAAQPAPTTSPSAAAPAASARESAPEVSVISVATDAPGYGRLTFDGLAAGDPDAARHGKLVLFLHGFPTTAESYREILPRVAAEGYYAVAINQRGYSPGARPEAVEAYGIAELVRDVGRVADALGGTTFHVVGHDWGGAVAWVSAVLLRDRISTLTVLSTPHPDALSDGMADPTHPQHEASAYMTTLRGVGSEDRLLVDGADSFTATFGPAKAGPSPELARDVGGIPTDKVARYADVLATSDALRAALNWYRANPLPIPVKLGPVTVPTLYLWGADDRAFVRATAAATASHVEGPYVFRELAGKSHWLPEEAADDIVESLLDHLTRVR